LFFKVFGENFNKAKYLCAKKAYIEFTTNIASENKLSEHTKNYHYINTVMDLNKN
jgi:hypothetical protein